MARSQIAGRQRTVATLKDVADRAGVSAATVSRVLNGVPTVDQAFRSRVNHAIIELQYSPNEVARSLRTSATHTVGMIVPEIANPFAMEVASGAMRVFRSHGYITMVSASDSSTANERYNLKSLNDKQVDGLLITPVDPDGRALEILNARVPVVLIDYVTSAHLDSVRVDNVNGAFLGVAHLASRGYRRIATIAGPQEHTSDRERLDGFQRAMRFQGLEIPDSYVRYGDFFVEGGYRECRRLLNECTDVEAILVANNLMGIGALRAIRDSGRRVPSEVALCVFDDFLMADMAAPPLTVLAQPTFSIGEVAARMLIERITRSETGAARQVLLKPTLIVREST